MANPCGTEEGHDEVSPFVVIPKFTLARGLQDIIQGNEGMQGEIGFKRRSYTRPLHISKCAAGIQTSPRQIKLRLHNDLEEPLKHIAATLCINCELMRSC